MNLAFNFMLLHSEFRTPQLRDAVERAEQLLPADAWPVWTGGNHDNHRFPTRWCKNDPARTRAALVMLMGLRGTPFLYYGDEIGMIDTDVPEDRILDPVGVFHGPRMGRDDERTPMHWSPAPGAGFSAPGVEPWLPYGDFAACNVTDQRPDPESTLSLTRDLIGLRDALPELRDGTYRRCPRRTTTCGCGCAANAPSSRATSRTRRSTSTMSGPARSASRRSAPATTSVSTTACTSRRGKP